MILDAGPSTVFHHWGGNTMFYCAQQNGFNKNLQIILKRVILTCEITLVGYSIGHDNNPAVQNSTLSILLKTPSPLHS